jgi:hypothetical protein
MNRRLVFHGGFVDFAIAGHAPLHSESKSIPPRRLQLTVGSLLRRVDSDATLLFGETEKDIACIGRGRRSGNRDGNEYVIVSNVGRDRVRDGTCRQIVKKLARLGIDDAEGWRGVLAARGVEMIFARVVPDFVRAMRIGDRRDYFTR